MANQVLPAPEFSRPVSVDRVGFAGLALDIEATAGERAALARRFGLISLDRLEAQARFTLVRPGFVRVEGRFEAEVVQACVVSLAPVPARHSVAFSLDYDKSAPDEAGEIDLSPDAPEPPEPLRGGSIDLGEAAVQQMAVALDPYPRAPEAKTGFSAEEERGESPFAALVALRSPR
jgi:hypothetical protein